MYCKIREKEYNSDIIVSEAGLINSIILGGRTCLSKIKNAPTLALGLLCELCASLFDFIKKKKFCHPLSCFCHDKLNFNGMYIIIVLPDRIGIRQLPVHIDGGTARREPCPDLHPLPLTNKNDFAQTFPFWILNHEEHEEHEEKINFVFFVSFVVKIELPEFVFFPLHYRGIGIN